MLNRLLLCTLVAGLLFSCKDDFSLEGDFQDVPTAYAFLDADDDRHFVRVQKAFLEAGGDANQNAAIADSIFYGENDAMVILRNLTRNDSTELMRVNGEDFGLDREDGVFATSPNILYTLEDGDLELRGGDEINLIVRRPGETDAVAETSMLREIEITRPVEPFAVIDDYRRSLNVTWSKGDNAAAYAVSVVFKINEINLNDPALTQEVELEWMVNNEYIPGDDEESGRFVTIRIDNEAFYRFLGENLEPDDNLRRRFLGMDINVVAAGEEIVERRQLDNANQGITSSQVTPTYTNLEGGLGLVTSTTRTSLENVALDNSSIDSLRDGIYTRLLNF
ncbi:hypothetical protein [Lewinella sp. 4G2]|uniref:hypothetical protein n=1 Tax=Lewinella sp. 4G2 TaxID=1803372 RepID=UPI0012F88BF9|nr:hypothetical protein [Lewinella sp. 4G2]